MGVRAGQRSDLRAGYRTGWTLPPERVAVTVVLHVTTDCGDDGAVCTGDSRKLSNRLEVTVSGPGH